MRHLIVCCDGTWNSPQEEAATNVVRLHSALDDTAEDGTEQVPYYHSGVGTEGGLLDYVLGGAAGAGLGRNVLDAYYWLTTTYRSEDRIALFGFSRGAYTVRSLAAMIASGGLLDTTTLDDTTIWHQIESVYRRYRQRDRASSQWRQGLRFSFDPEYAYRIPVHFIGVWETVGALGIPDYLGWLNLVDPRRRYRFHDVRLSPHVAHARQALALDENRSPFSPARWEAAPNQDLQQVWFPGSHLDVGGGHQERGLSDGALQWMIEQARGTIGLAFHKTTLEQIRPDPLGVLHDDNRIFTGWLTPALSPLTEPFFAPRPRATPLIDPPDPSLHESVSTRYQQFPITAAPYRPTQVLTTGASATVRVQAHEPWNWTELYLEPGDYTFTARGQWVNRTTASGPAGTTGLRQYLPTGGLRLLGTLFGKGEKVFRRLFRNQVANFLCTRREEDLPWMSLVGVVANDAHIVAQELEAHERIHIGAGTNHRVYKAGYLYTFANDAWSFYGDNRGSVQLTVTRKNTI